MQMKLKKTIIGLSFAALFLLGAVVNKKRNLRQL